MQQYLSDLTTVPVSRHARLHVAQRSQIGSHRIQVVHVYSRPNVHGSSDQTACQTRGKSIFKKKIEIKINQKVGQRMLWVFIVLPSFRGDLTNEMASQFFGRFAIGRVQAVEQHH